MQVGQGGGAACQVQGDAAVGRVAAPRARAEQGGPFVVQQQDGGIQVGATLSARLQAAGVVRVAVQDADLQVAPRERVGGGGQAGGAVDDFDADGGVALGAQDVVDEVLVGCVGVGKQG